ncbi:MAG: hypothetical protein JWN21_2145 [Sphingomonas bacterium]|uniref:thioredoxin domain-containing protein n=1 Tax=Sphingomonas bacterium TaxID=1895847 RepID=UPI002605F4E4|nr:thioredoxin domain-containing protein [Sphingomonas bacterium]MDB5696602.1 hypothetical protein [Sphingomonas bacterium]
MRILFVFSALMALTAAAPARDWSTVAAKTPAGAYVIGNPRAAVKLIEYASYTCSHCAEFSVESDKELKGRLIRTGAVSLEFRHFVFNGIDLAAAILARCTGPRGFAATTGYLFATQGEWLPRGAAFLTANQQRITMYPRAAQIRAMADGAGLTAAVVARGLSPKAVDACFADTAEIDRILAMTANKPAAITSTPSFYVNGKLVTNAHWAELQPHLRAAGAR